MRKLCLGAMALAILAACDQRLPLEHPPSLSATTTVQFDPAGSQGVGEVRTVTVDANVMGAEGQDAKLELIAPSGDLYQRQLGTLSGSPYESQHLQFSLPVSGTPIDSSNLAGVWHARLFAGDQLLATQDFELKP